MSRTESIVEATRRFSANHYGQYPVVFEKGKGVYITDVEGKEYVDCVSSYSALPFGHCNPELIETAKAQLDKLHLCGGFVYHPGQGPVLKQLCEMSGLDKALMMNSGAEAVEASIKIARKWAYVKKGVPVNEAEIITCANNFHGRTTTIVGFSTTKQYHELFGPPTPGFKSIPFGDLTALEAAITENTAAFLVEPAQGEGGIVFPPEGYLKAAYDICRQKNVLLILDEIQTGLGRTGKLFAHHWEPGVRPDLMTLGKALSGGISAVSAVVGTEETVGILEPGDHGSTFASNPFACAVTSKALEIIQRDNLAERSLEIGQYLFDKLKSIRSPYISKIRGKGLFIGMVLSDDAPPSNELIMSLYEAGLLINSTKGAIRVTPPLTIEKDEIDELVRRMKTVLCV